MLTFSCGPTRTTLFVPSDSAKLPLASSLRTPDVSSIGVSLLATHTTVLFTILVYQIPKYRLWELPKLKNPRVNTPPADSMVLSPSLKENIQGKPPGTDFDVYHPGSRLRTSFDPNKSGSDEDQKCISILLSKQDIMQWCKYLVKGDEEVDTQKVEPESSKLYDLDGETRSTMEKMMVKFQHISLLK
ncbi:hypothetical protein AgCh_038879 [Apium graveolens]